MTNDTSMWELCLLLCLTVIDPADAAQVNYLSPGVVGNGGRKDLPGLRIDWDACTIACDPIYDPPVCPWPDLFDEPLYGV